MKLIWNGKEISVREIPDELKNILKNQSLELLVKILSGISSINAMQEDNLEKAIAIINKEIVLKKSHTLLANITTIIQQIKEKELRFLEYQNWFDYLHQNWDGYLEKLTKITSTESFDLQDFISMVKELLVIIVETEKTVLIDMRDKKIIQLVQQATNNLAYSQSFKDATTLQLSILGRPYLSSARISATPDIHTHYDILGLPVNVDQEIINEAFDKFKTTCQGKTKEDCAKALGITLKEYLQRVEAFNTLVDLYRRQEYDESDLVKLLDIKHRELGFPVDYARLKAEECMQNKTDNHDEFVFVEDRRKEMSKSPKADQFIAKLLQLANPSPQIDLAERKLVLEKTLKSQSPVALTKIYEEINKNTTPKNIYSSKRLINAIIQEEKYRKNNNELFEKELAALKSDYDDLWALKINPPQDRNLGRILQEKATRLQQLEAVMQKYTALINADNIGNANLVAIINQIENLKLEFQRLLRPSIVITNSGIEQYQTHYDVLGLPLNVSQDAINIAYEQFPRVTPGRDEKACAELLEINVEEYRRKAEAFRTLINLQSREEYDNTTLAWQLKVKHQLLGKYPSDYAQLKTEECMKNKTDKHGRIIPVTQRRAGLSQSPEANIFFHYLLNLANPDSIDDQMVREITLANSLKSQSIESLKQIKEETNKKTRFENLNVYTLLFAAVINEENHRLPGIVLLEKELAPLKSEYDDLWALKINPPQDGKLLQMLQAKDTRLQQLKELIQKYEALKKSLNSENQDLTLIKLEIEKLKGETTPLMTQSNVTSNKDIEQYQTYYDVLGMPANVSQDNINKAFEHFLRVIPGRDEKACANLLGIDLQEYRRKADAFKSLINLQNREEYDNTSLVWQLRIKHRLLRKTPTDYAQLKAEECMKCKSDNVGNILFVHARRSGASQSPEANMFFQNILNLADPQNNQVDRKITLENVLKSQSSESLIAIREMIHQAAKTISEQIRVSIITAIKEEEMRRQSVINLFTEKMPLLKREYDDLWYKIQPVEGEEMDPNIREMEKRWQKLNTMVVKYETLMKEINSGNVDLDCIKIKIEELNKEIRQHLTPIEDVVRIHQEIASSGHSLYDVLNLPVNVDQSIIKNAFDKFPKISDRITEIDCAKLLGITIKKYKQQAAAFLTLTNEVERDQYDNNELIDLLTLKYRKMESLDKVDYAQLKAEECMKSMTDFRGRDIPAAERRQCAPRCQTPISVNFLKNLLRLANPSPEDNREARYADLNERITNQSLQSLKMIKAEIYNYRKVDLKNVRVPSPAYSSLLNAIKKEEDRRQTTDRSTAPVSGAPIAQRKT